MLIPLGILDYPVAVAGAGSYDLLETEILTGTQASVTFSSLNSTYGADYQHLQLRLTGRTDRASTSDYIEIRLNSDAGGNYAHHSLYGNGSSVASAAQTSDSKMDFNRVAGASAAANIFGAIVLDLLDPFETTKYSTLRSLGGEASISINLNSGLWMNTAAITTLQVLPGSGSNLVSGCRLSLYGLKGA